MPQSSAGRPAPPRSVRIRAPVGDTATRSTTWRTPKHRERRPRCSPWSAPARQRCPADEGSSPKPSLDGDKHRHLLIPGILTAFGIGICFVTGTVAAMSGVAMPQAGLASVWSPPRGSSAAHSGSPCWPRSRRRPSSAAAPRPHLRLPPRVPRRPRIRGHGAVVASRDLHGSRAAAGRPRLPRTDPMTHRRPRLPLAGSRARCAGSPAGISGL